MKSTYLALPLALLLMAGCTNEEDASPNQKVEEPVAQEETVTVTIDDKEEKEATAEPVSEELEETEEPTVDSNSDLFSGYQLINVDGGDLSGYREANVVVDIGYGEREYWVFTTNMVNWFV